MKVELLAGQAFAIYRGKTTPFAQFLRDQAEKIRDLEQRAADRQRGRKRAHQAFVQALTDADPDIQARRDELTQAGEACQRAQTEIDEAKAVSAQAADCFTKARAGAIVTAQNKALAAIVREIENLLRKNQP